MQPQAPSSCQVELLSANKTQPRKDEKDKKDKKDKKAKKDKTAKKAKPANCTGADDSLRPEDVDVQGEDPACEGNQCAAAVDGGVDEISPVQLWDAII